MATPFGGASGNDPDYFLLGTIDKNANFDNITTIISGEDTVSVAMQEVVDGTLSFAKEDFDAEIKGSNELVEHNR